MLRPLHPLLSSLLRVGSIAALVVAASACDSIGLSSVAGGAFSPAGDGVPDATSGDAGGALVDGDGADVPSTVVDAGMASTSVGNPLCFFAFDDGSVAQLTSVWHQVLTRESGRHLEVFCEGAALWTDDDYLGPLHVQTSAGTREIMGELPDWAGLLTVPQAYAESIAHYGAAAKAFLDGLVIAAGGGYPGAAEALAAHRLVDGAYRSAAAGGAPISTGRAE